MDPPETERAAFYSWMGKHLNQRCINLEHEKQYLHYKNQSFSDFIFCLQGTYPATDKDVAPFG